MSQPVTKKTTRLMSFVLVFVFLFANICVYNKAKADYYSFGYISLPDGTIAITDLYVDYLVSDIDELIIPDSIDGKPVTAIGDRALTSRRISKVVIPDSVVEMGANPFMVMDSIVISPNHPVFALIDGVLFNKTDKRLISYPFYKPGNSYTIPNGIEIIGSYAFYYAYYPNEIIIPDSVKVIEDYAFEECQYLTSITIPQSVYFIGANPFMNCFELTDIIVNNSPYFEAVDHVLFNKIDNKLICFPYALASESSLISHYHMNHITSYVIPYGTKEVGPGAFRDCNTLKDIVIPDTVQYIGAQAFERCSSLKAIHIPDSVIRIDWDAFRHCNDVEELTFGRNVSYIGSGAFCNIQYVTDIVLPQGLTEIGKEAFKAETHAFTSYGLQSVYIPQSVEWIGEDAFSGWNNLLITVEQGSYADEYCQYSNLQYTYPNSLDWLTGNQNSSDASMVSDNNWYDSSVQMWDSESDIYSGITVDYDESISNYSDGLLFYVKQVMVEPDGTISITFTGNNRGNKKILQFRLCSWDDIRYKVVSIDIPSQPNVITNIKNIDVPELVYAMNISAQSSLDEFEPDATVVFRFLPKDINSLRGSTCRLFFRLELFCGDAITGDFVDQPPFYVTIENYNPAV